MADIREVLWEQVVPLGLKDALNQDVGRPWQMMNKCSGRDLEVLIYRPLTVPSKR